MRKSGLRLLAMVLVVVMLACSVVACGNSTSSDGSTVSDSSQAAQSGDTAIPMDISISFWDIGKCFPEDVNDEVYEQFKKATGVTIKPVNITWDDYSEKTQLWAASGELPDVFTCDSRFAKVEIYNSWVNQKIVKAIPDDLSKYPNLQDFFNKADIGKYKDTDGTFYCIPRQSYPDARDTANGAAFFIRKDWMEKCGITEDPKNMDDLIAICKAFTEQDPDGDNVDDTIGLTAWSMQRALLPMLSILPSLTEMHWVKEDGQWIPTIFSEEALPAIKEYKRLFDSGYVDKDMPILKGTEGMDKFFGDKAGIFIHQNYLEPSQIESFNAAHDGKTWSDLVTTVKLWPYKDGKYYYAETDTCFSESYINANVSDEKLDKILSMFDWMMSSEWNDLRNYGIEGTDYKRNGDSIEVIRSKDANGLFVPLSQQYPMLTMMNQFIDWNTTFKMFEDPTMDKGVQSIYTELRKWYHENTVSNVSNWEIELMYTPSKGKVAGIDYSSSIWKIIMSNDPDATYKQVCDEMKKSGFTDYIREVNEEATKRGIN